MKLIIDIPDNDYNGIVEQVKNNDYPDMHTGKAIANGTPYEPKGDLISREDLKEKAETVTLWNGDVRRFVSYETIDNAPTVEPCYQTTSCLDCKNYDKETHNCPRYCEVIKEAIKSRQQGEWINHRNDNGHNIADCSLCSKATQWHDEDEDGIPRYCWYCGAKMKGDKE